MTYDFGHKHKFASYLATHPVIGGDTKVTLTSANTLQSLGVTVTPLGSASVDASGPSPVADFPITGGTKGPGSSLVILHQGSGLELADSVGKLDLEDFRIDTRNGLVDANVLVNGQSAGNVAVFDIGADGTTLTLTPTAAGVVDETLGTTAVTSDVVIGTATPSPITGLFGFDWQSLRFIHTADTQPIVGGNTAVTLTSASTLQSLGVSVTPLGSAWVDSSGADPVANFHITGGTEGPGSALVILHQGSGLQLADSAGTLSLTDFLIDTQNSVIDANVSVNGQSAGNVAVFKLGADGATLTLTATAATVADKALGTMAITSDVVIGTAAPSPFALCV